MRTPAGFSFSFYTGIERATYQEDEQRIYINREKYWGGKKYLVNCNIIIFMSPSLL